MQSQFRVREMGAKKDTEWQRLKGILRDTAEAPTSASADLEQS
jgi:hypothetical protein